MTIDTNFLPMPACAIQPIKAKMNDNENSTHLSVKIINDDLSTQCTLYWALLGADGQVNLYGNLFISGSSYQDWSGDNLFPFNYVATQLGLTFI